MNRYHATQKGNIKFTVQEEEETDSLKLFNLLPNLKKSKKESLDRKFSQVSDRPIVDTGLGFEVHGGYQDLADFTVGEDLGITTIRAVDNSMNDVTDVQFQSVILAIKMKGLMLKQNKWALADSITAATTEAELDAININEGW